MGASGADHLLPVVIMNPRRSAVLRMNERCEPQRQISRLIALDRVLFGNFHEALIISRSFGSSRLQIRTLEAWALTLFLGASEIGAKA